MLTDYLAAEVSATGVYEIVPRREIQKGALGAEEELVPDLHRQELSDRDRQSSTD
jgi:hypothetical protein